MSAPDAQLFLRELDKKLWSAADRLRSNLDAAVYKHAVLEMTRLTAHLKSQFTESAKLEAAIKENLKGLGYGI